MFCSINISLKFSAKAYFFFLLNLLCRLSCRLRVGPRGFGVYVLLLLVSGEFQPSKVKNNRQRRSFCSLYYCSVQSSISMQAIQSVIQSVFTGDVQESDHVCASKCRIWPRGTMVQLFPCLENPADKMETSLVRAQTRECCC